MELRQLKYFVAVAELKNFSQASHLLNITQSTMSQQIKQLEDELGVQLLHRTSHHVSLTDMGEAFLPQARRTISTAKACLDSIHDVQELNVGELNIGSTYTFLPLLKETVLEFMKCHPGIKLNIKCHSMETLIKMLDEQKIDVALTYKPTQNYPNIDSFVIFDNRLAVVVSDTHPIAKSELLRLADLEKIPLALPARGLQARNCFDRLVEDGDYRFDVRLEINEVNVLLDLIRGSHMATVLSQATVTRTPGLKAIMIDHSGTSMEGSFNVRRDVYMKRATKEFLRMLSENRSYGMAMMDLF